MVKSGLDENPYVSPYRLVFHLTNALIIYSILIWCSLNSFFNTNIFKGINSTINTLFYFGIFLLSITIISGGFMAGTDAGKSFNTFPLMSNKLIPEGYFLLDNKFLNFFENTIAINFNHRWLASLTFIYIFSTIFYLLFFSKYKKNKLSLILVLLFVSLQFFLGILTLIYNVPISLASLHQTNSTLLLTFMLYAFHRHRSLNAKITGNI